MVLAQKGQALNAEAVNQFGNRQAYGSGFAHIFRVNAPVGIGKLPVQLLNKSGGFFLG